MTKKLLLVGLAAILIVGSFFVGIKYGEAPKDNTKNDVVKEEDDGLNLDSLFETANIYAVGENRTILPIKNARGKITLAYVYEVKDVVDKENGLSYRIYRVGGGEESPTRSAGRIFLQVAESKLAGTPVSVYDTEIDAFELEILGKTFLREGKLIITCSGQVHAMKNLCEYQVDFSKDIHNLVVTRNI
ncbi:MAG: hypothetical protein G01um101413_703 [Parcubacteria group bacterium Gr01-1014_13]|nr:MAG: hypothetical protein G01um101413_703 [Parcubacteria group bacterium Gr01-1014_13]